MADKRVERRNRQKTYFLISGKITHRSKRIPFSNIRKLVNRRLKTAQNEFCKQFFKELPTSKEQWSFIKKRIGKERECLVIDKLVDGETEVEKELDIANCLNRSFQKLGLYNGQYVSAPNISRIEVREKF